MPNVRRPAAFYTMLIHEIGEFGLIERLAVLVRDTEQLPAAGRVVLGVGDDASVLELPPDRQLVATVDALVEDVHFRRPTTSPEDLGWKALAVNVSDLGAMGARPLAALLTLALPPSGAVEWVERLYSGLAEAARRYRCAIAGGDTVRSPDRIAVTVTALGSVPSGRAIRRSGARAADLVCVTGVLGQSAAGLALLEAGQTPESAPEFGALLRAHRRPEPPVEAGVALADAGLPTAMIDLSDGLVSDLEHIVRQSGVGARVVKERLPISLATRQAAESLGVDPHTWVLHGGEDYGLLFTIPPDRFARVPPLLAPLGVVATIVGEMGGTDLLIEEEDGTAVALVRAGFQHFAVGKAGIVHRPDG
ncbi:MAG: thiamine-phosphate kinase [Armatimonadetes bacterium]|nr:thiamine-phosphate kinase [Armatimonadota bacterium]